MVGASAIGEDAARGVIMVGAGPAPIGEATRVASLNRPWLGGTTPPPPPIAVGSSSGPLPPLFLRRIRTSTIAPTPPATSRPPRISRRLEPKLLPWSAEAALVLVLAGVSSVVGSSVAVSSVTAALAAAEAVADGVAEAV